MSRERGTTVELLDYKKLAAVCEEHGLTKPSYGTNGLLRRVDGAVVVLSSEGVGPLEVREGMAGIDTEWASDWGYLPVEAVEACRTGETADLADHIRTFGSRLDVNHWQWADWAKGGDR
jgi:hypothetical protein